MAAVQPLLDVLLLEDSDLDADLTATYLAKGGMRCRVLRARDQESFLAGLQTGPALVLADYALPNFDGLTALDLTRQTCPDLPFIFVSGVLGEEVAIETLKRGATDFVSKRKLDRLAQAAHRALEEAGDRRQRRLAEQKLREQEGRLVYQLLLTDTIARCAAEALFLLDPQGRVNYLNPAAVSTFGWTLEDLRGRVLLDVLQRRQPEDPAASSNPSSLERAVAMAQSITNHEDLFYHRDGTAVHVLCSNSPVQHEGKITGSVLSVKDVTGLKKVARLEEADRRKNEFLAMLSHELRNPLGPVLAALDVLGRENIPPAMTARAREVVTRQVKQMSRLVDDLLDVSRITNGKINLQVETVELCGLVEQAIEMSRHHLDQRGHRLLVSLPPRPFLLEADQARIQQVLSNLLNNAAKYTPPGGRVTLLVEPQGDTVLITVEDNGQGIAPEFLPQVFDLFAQEDRSLDRSQGGLGIGLTLAKTIAELHDGTIDARSAGQGQGSTFALRLPVRDPMARAVSQTPPSEPEIRLDGLRILIVDDSADSVQMLADLLRLSGYQVLTALDGPTGLAAARTFRPNVALLDIGLPGMTGYQLARQLRQLPEGAEMLLVAVTGYGREEDRRLSAEAGFQHHLVKPIQPNVLGSLLERTASERQAPTHATLRLMG